MSKFSPRTGKFLFLLLFTAAFLFAPVAAASDAQSLEGYWEGSIEVPGSPLALSVHFAKAGDAWSGHISIPAQQARDLSLSQIQVSSADVSFALPGVPGDPKFTGKIAPDGKSVSGDFSQGGQKLPFRLTRAKPPAAAAEEALAGFEAFVDQAREAWKVPGLAIAIVKGDQVVLEKGFGYRDLEKKLPATPATLFAIGSCTKAFTTFVLGTLVDEGKLEWDKPVGNYIPGFKLYDRVATERMTPLDLVTHRSGLPRHDALWYNANLSRKEMVERLQYLEPSKDFRTDFQYNNAMFLTAGYLIEKVTGESWEEGVRRRVFAPLAMTHSNFSVADSQKASDFALPYEERDDKVQIMAFRNITNVGRAGSINSSVEDLVPWMRVHLNGGKLGTQTIVNASTIADLHTPRMETGQKQDEPEVVPGGYAPGWFTDTYRGHLRVHHGGGIDGFSALIVLLPADQIGIAILTNMNGTGLHGVLARHAIDRLLALPLHDWNAERLKRKQEGRDVEKEAQSKKNTIRKTGTKPAHRLEEYAGEYEHPGYGVMKIAWKGGRLEMTYNDITTPLEHWHYEVWNGVKIEGEKADHTFEDFRVMFVTNMDGDVSAVEAPMEPAVKDILFTRRPDAKLADPEYLKRFTGSYELGPQKISVDLKGNTLTLEVDGQRQPDLVPDRNNRFMLKGASGFSIQFLTDAKGKVTGAQFNQPDGVYTAKKQG